MQYRLPQPYYYDSGPVGVVLLHAYTGSANDVHMMGRFLEKQQISVLAPHFTGHATFEPLDILEEGSVQAWWRIQRLPFRSYKLLPRNHYLFLGCHWVDCSRCAQSKRCQR